jgi:hypothetical protein
VSQNKLKLREIALKPANAGEKAPKSHLKDIKQRYILLKLSCGYANLGQLLYNSVLRL